jgi:glutathione reductase (NADPH)
MAREYNVVVIGTGTAGRTFIGKILHSGFKIAVVDSREYGGTCPLRGCDPKKVLTGITELTEWSNRLRGKGIRTENPLAIDWPSLIEFKSTFSKGYSAKTEKYFLENGVDVYHGRASFDNRNTVAVGDHKLKGEYIFLATGSKPRELKIPGEEHVISSEEFMEIEKLPEKVLFIGGGYISFEFAHVAKRAGSEVTILHRSEKPLSPFDSDLVNLLLKASEAAAIRILTNKPVIAVEKEYNGFLVRTELKSEARTETQTFSADMVVHGAGRIPDIEDLHLEKAGVKIENGGIAVDKHMQTSNSHIYAGGDCTSKGIQLTPVATLQGQVAASNILNEDNGIEVDYTGIPSAVFTIPVLASVGISAPRDSSAYKVVFRDRSSWNTTRRAGVEFAASKVIIDEAKDRIVGAHILGPNAEEAINIFATIMRMGLKASDIKKLIFSYPTVCSDIPYML